jgi:hypothetical protein
VIEQIADDNGTTNRSRGDLGLKHGDNTAFHTYVAVDYHSTDQGRCECLCRVGHNGADQTDDHHQNNDGSTADAFRYPTSYQDADRECNSGESAQIAQVFRSNDMLSVLLESTETINECCINDVSERKSNQMRKKEGVLRSMAWIVE